MRKSLYMAFAFILTVGMAAAQTAGSATGTTGTGVRPGTTSQPSQPATGSPNVTQGTPSVTQGTPSMSPGSPAVTGSTGSVAGSPGTVAGAPPQTTNPGVSPTIVGPCDNTTSPNGTSTLNT